MSLNVIECIYSEQVKHVVQKEDKNVPPIFHCSELYSRELLDLYLSRALGMELEKKQLTGVELEKERLTAIDDSAYVLTMDYTIKMLNIHERSDKV